MVAISSGLRAVSDDSSGIRRVRAGGGFRYVGCQGRAIRSVATLDRIRKLAIPPAWTDVWICPRADGHIQATGRDARGRKQYRYHPDWHQHRDGTKFDQLVAFGRMLPRLRRRVDADLAQPGLPREKVLAAAVDLLDRTNLRVGNPEYARTNGSFGLSTLLDRHIETSARGVRLKFRGKSGVRHDRTVEDRRLAKVVRSCRDLPGQSLFQYLDEEGRQRRITSADVNEYLRTVTGTEITTKVFRTWAGTVLAAVKLGGLDRPETKAATARAVVGVVKEVAEELGNTPAVCRASYIHPAVIGAFQAGKLQLPRVRRRPRGLFADEARVLAFLSRQKGGGG
jgi:DNA topoisomerase-1